MRKLFALSRQMIPELFLQTLERAHQYRIGDFDTLQRIALLYPSQGMDLLPPTEVDESFRDRPAYQDGALTEAPDLSIYDDEPDEQDGKPSNPS